MRITVDIPDELLEEAMRRRELRAQRTAVVTALSEYVRRRAAEDLRGRLGTFQFIWRDLDEFLHWRRTGCWPKEHGGESDADDD